MAERRGDGGVDWAECSLVEVNPRKVSGVPILKDTRVQADSIVENYLSGSSVNEIVKNFNIGKSSIVKLIEYAEKQSGALAELLRSKVYFAAACYLDEWIRFDRRAMRALSEQSVDGVQAVEELCHVATYYAVARGFKKRDGEVRFADVWVMLKSCRRPTDSAETIKLVDDVVGAIKVVYGKELLSAATKFLWMRF